MKYGFGIDLGGTTVKIAYFDETGKMLEKWEIPTDTSENGFRILPDIAASVRAFLTERKIADSDILGLGIGVPGPVNAKGVVNRCINLGWDVFNIAQKLTELTGFPVKAGNDANGAALGEFWKGGGQGYKDLVVVTLGTGVGGGIIVDGKVVAGFNGAGGEIGHITVNHDEIEACNCGQYGCLEQYTSATGIVRVAKRKLAKTNDETSLRNFPELTAKDVFDEAKSGDAVALGLVDEVCGILGSTLSNIACVVDPEVVVIGGGVSKAGSILIESIQKHFVETSFHACRNTKFVPAGLGNDAGMYGCVQMLLD